MCMNLLLQLGFVSSLMSWWLFFLFFFFWQCSGATFHSAIPGFHHLLVSWCSVRHCLLLKFLFLTCFLCDMNMVQLLPFYLLAVSLLFSTCCRSLQLLLQHFTSETSFLIPAVAFHEAFTATTSFVSASSKVALLLSINHLLPWLFSTMPLHSS